MDSVRFSPPLTMIHADSLQVPSAHPEAAKEPMDLLVGAQVIQPLEMVQPTNAAKQKKLFLSGQIEEPDFTYPAPAEKANIEVARALDGLVFEDGTLGQLQDKKRSELLALNLIAAHPGDSAIVKAATQAVYGRPSLRLVAQAQKLLEILPVPAKAPDGERVSLGRRLSDELASYGLDDWKLTESNGGSTHVDPANKQVVVPVGRDVASVVAERLAVHEVGVHALRAANGYQQPDSIFALGTAGYEATEEGLAAYAEIVSGTTDSGVLRKYAARVLAVESVAEGKDFRETFDMLSEQGLSKNQAWDVSLRVHRGGGYLKDHIYLEGLMGVRDYAKSGGDLRKLFVGKVSLDDLPTVDRMLASGDLKLPKHLPHFMSQKNLAANPLLAALDEASGAR